MNPRPPQLARALFLKAVEDGPVEIPAAVLQALQRLSSQGDQPHPLDTFALREQVAEQFSIWNTLHTTGTLEQTEPCLRALRWVLRELRVWTPNTGQPWLHLQVLLASLAAFDAANAEVDDVLRQFMSQSFPEGFGQLLAQAEARQIGPSLADNSWRDEIQAAGRDGHFEQLKAFARHPNIHLAPDTRLAIYLLWRLRPDSLVALINQKRDIFLSCSVCSVLADSAPRFALDVDDVTFKYFSVAPVADVRPADAPAGAMDVFRDLLLQVAESQHWRSWLQAYYRYPKGNTVADEALSRSLGQLEVRHWADFIDSVQLWTCLGTVAPLTNILIGFYQEVGNPGAREMWSLAFRRWNQWDYGHGEPGEYMFAPAACSFDFPVAMYYAHLAPEEVKAEESRLIDAIASVEQTWFSSASDLITYRNRLLSRLRLVRHGRLLASGTTEALPPPVQPDGEYAALRYLYFDVNSR